MLMMLFKLKRDGWKGVQLNQQEENVKQPSDVIQHSLRF